MTWLAICSAHLDQKTLECRKTILKTATKSRDQTGGGCVLNWRLSFAVVIVLMLAAKFHAGVPDPPREFQLQANSAEFCNLFDPGTKLSTVASGFGFAEGPVWDPAG